MEISNWYFIAKAMHLIGMVSWMAGLFYLVRLMVYHAEASDRPETERAILTRQYNLMEWKVYKVIIQPAIVITWAFGTLMLVLQPVLLEQAWLIVKLFFVVLLTGYSLYCRSQIVQLEKGTASHSHVFYRGLNEVPTIILAAAVFLAVFKTRINWWYLVIGLGLFSGLILYAIFKLVRKIKAEKQPDTGRE